MEDYGFSFHEVSDDALSFVPSYEIWDDWCFSMSEPDENCCCQFLGIELSLASNKNRKRRNLRQKKKLYKNALSFKSAWNNRDSMFTDEDLHEQKMKHGLSYDLDDFLRWDGNNYLKKFGGISIRKFIKTK